MLKMKANARKNVVKIQASNTEKKSSTILRIKSYLNEMTWQNS